MEALDALRAAIPDVAKDIRPNVSAVMKGGALTEAQRWGVAVTSAITARNPRRRAAGLADAGRAAPPEVVDDAVAAAIMAMNNVYYRYRHGCETRCSHQPQSAHRARDLALRLPPAAPARLS